MLHHSLVGTIRYMQVSCQDTGRCSSNPEFGCSRRGTAHGARRPGTNQLRNSGIAFPSPGTEIVQSSGQFPPAPSMRRKPRGFPGYVISQFAESVTNIPYPGSPRISTKNAFPTRGYGGRPFGCRGTRNRQSGRRLSTRNQGVPLDQSRVQDGVSSQIPSVVSRRWNVDCINEFAFSQVIDLFLNGSHD
jgi:hypothetical protein